MERDTPPGFVLLWGCPNWISKGALRINWFCGFITAAILFVCFVNHSIHGLNPLKGLLTLCDKETMQCYEPSANDFIALWFSFNPYPSVKVNLISKLELVHQKSSSLRFDGMKKSAGTVTSLVHMLPQCACVLAKIRLCGPSMHV